MSVLPIVLLIAAAAAPGAGPPPSGREELSAAVAAEQAGDLDAARAHLEAAVERAPWLGVAWVELAEVLLRAGVDGPQLDGALAQGQRLEPGNPRLWRLVGMADEVEGDAAGAQQAYEKSLALRGDDPQAHFRLAGLLAAAGKVDQAIAQYRMVTQISPREPAAHLALADLLKAKNDLAAAEAELALLVGWEPANALYRDRLRLVLVAEGKAAPEPSDRRKMRPLRKSKW